jgi:oxygen-independent coproporphyrinogen-3 oxidase
MRQVKDTFQQSNASKGISIYLHLPFCERLCTYCGCIKRITKNHQVELPYINSLLQEWQTYLGHFQRPPIIRELHLGGGTPTFFQPNNLRKLIEGLMTASVLHRDYDFGFEGSPENTTLEHLVTLYSLGFRRLSLGVQDFDPKVQKAVNRIQDFQQVRQVINDARDIGYSSINLDLIYGLPFQTAERMNRTLEAVGRLRPDRIAFYSYAHVPWKSPSQRGYSENDLPKGAQKRQLYEMGKKSFIDQGYVEIGMDHFALKTDAIARAHENLTLHRNFMGYTVSNTDLLIGLGTSAISDAKTAYAQNEKTVEKYQKSISDQGLALFRGHFLNSEDQLIRDTILELICNEKVILPQQLFDNLKPDQLDMLQTMQQEGLIEEKGLLLRVTASGKPFIRNICSVFDQYLSEKVSQGEQIFSKSI